MPTARYDNTDGRLRGRKLQVRRLRKWTEAEGRCAKCDTLTHYADPRVDPQGFHLDHIAHLDKSKDDSEENTQVLCVPCHLIKTAQDFGHRVKVKVGEDGWRQCVARHEGSPRRGMCAVGLGGRTGRNFIRCACLRKHIRPCSDAGLVTGICVYRSLGQRSGVEPARLMKLK